MKLLIKQEHAVYYLKDSITEEVLYGGQPEAARVRWAACGSWRCAKTIRVRAGLWGATNSKPCAKQHLTHVSLYTPPGSTFYLKNTTTQLQQQFPNPGRVSRLVFSDGRTDETLENLLPLVEGVNELRYMSSSVQKTTDKFITLEKVSYQKGVYLKWLNPMGGYSYWLFEDIHTIDRSTKYTGEIDRDYNNLENSFGRSIAIGKESHDTMRIIAEMLSPHESQTVETILDSPKVYLFTGKPFAQNGKNNWMEVSLKTTNARIKNAKQPLMNYTFDIELPERFTINL